MAVFKIGEAWYAKFPVGRKPDGKIKYQQKKVGFSKKLAEQYDRKKYDEFRLREMMGVPHESEKRKEYGVSELLDWFVTLDEVKALKSYKDVVTRTKPLKRFFQDRKANKLLPSDIKAYRAWRKKQRVRKHHKEKQIVCKQNLSNAAVNRETAILKQSFNVAIREQLLERNPCIGVKRLKEEPRNRACSREEFEALKSELPTDARDIVVVAYHTGMRYSEIVGLDWNRVDFKNRFILLRGEDTKNGEPRKVPFLCKEVEEVFERRGGNPRRIHGRVFGVTNIRNAFENACRRLGIKDLHFHDLRHTAATNMRKAKVDTATVMKICGWKSVQMFLRYNEVDDEDLDAASEAMAEAEEKRLKSHSENLAENTDLAFAQVEERVEKTRHFSHDFQNSSKRPNRLDSQNRNC